MKVVVDEEYITKHKDDPSHYEVIYQQYEDLIHHIAHRYHIYGYEHIDLVSIGAIKLFTLLEKWNPELGCKFSTFFSYSLDNEYKMLLRKHTNSKRGYGVVPMSLDAEVDNAEEIYLKDFIPDTNALKSFNLENPLDILEKYCSTLKKERDAVILKMYLLEDMNQRDIADSLGISQSYVSRLIKKHTQILKKMYS